MEKHEYARSVLTQARELLSERLVDYIADSADGILNDAEGLSYMSEIDDIQEKVLGRLINVNQMIANFPPPSPASNDQAITDQLTAWTTAELQASQQTETISQAAMPQQPQKFGLFVQQVKSNELNAAAQTLSDLLAIDLALSHQSTSAFYDQLTEDPATLKKAMLLPSKLQADKHNDCLVILWECFRLQGLQAIEVLHTLQHQIESAS